MAQKKRKWGMGPLDDFIAEHGLRDRFDALDPPKTATVRYLDQSYKLFIPDAMTDKMQIPALMGQFHEHSYLQAFASVVDPKGTVCDLGANFGSHTLFFAAVMKAQHVHSFEPQTRLAETIQETLRLNGLTNVTVHNAAAGAKPGVARLKKEYPENSGMTEFRPGDGAHTVPMLPLDDVVGDEHVTAVKIDVEGMQMPVLRGMSKTIRRCNPVLWLELRPAKGELEHPSQWLEERGYTRKAIGFRDFLFLPKGHRLA